MEKIIEDLNWRYACKQFDPNKQISENQLNTLLEALRLTPSSYGLQPWKFVVVENKDLREKLVTASWNQKQVRDASHLIVMCAPKTLDESFIDNYVSDTAKTRGQEPSDLAGFKKMLMMIPNKSVEGQAAWSKNQIYIALGNLMTTCAQMRIDTCPMEGFKPKEYDEILGLNELGLTSVLVCPVGYRSDEDKYSGLSKVRYAKDDLTIRI
ncbi:MAG: NAD(P)H-dependent oxidoreductase [Halobacteriovoraceae bacterium]|jgi:nitroreductase / dihydropteridine reductase|nr:NAD(P)H-dependent oxidoreductase [Halobacteriovoraceae bacterium]